jgi:hypothetical protein
VTLSGAPPMMHHREQTRNRRIRSSKSSASLVPHLRNRADQPTEGNRQLEDSAGASLAVKAHYKKPPLGLGTLETLD